MKSKAKRLPANHPAQQAVDHYFGRYNKATGKITFPPLPEPGISDTVSVRINAHVVNRLRFHAKASGRTISGMIYWVLRGWLELPEQHKREATPREVGKQ